MKEVVLMARAKKDSTYLNVKIDTSIYRRLERLCEEAGHTKTLVVERALVAYCDSFDTQQEMLRKIESGALSNDDVNRG